MCVDSCLTPPPGRYGEALLATARQLDGEHTELDGPMDTLAAILRRVATVLTASARV